MIFQCYFANEQHANIFDLPYYQGFGLEPEINPYLLGVCPELKFSAERKQLVEYAAMLYLWRNPPVDDHAWIGFTSWRQLDKTPFQLTENIDVNAMLNQYDILGWGHTRVLFEDCDLGPVCAIASENSHPGIIAYLRNLMFQFELEIPIEFWTLESDYFANYWIMSKDNFEEYMNWSWPIIRWGLKHRGEFQFTRDNDKALGFIAERLFIFWRHLYIKKAFNVGTEIVLTVAHASSPISRLTAALKSANLRIQELESSINIDK